MCAANIAFVFALEPLENRRLLSGSNVFSLNETAVDTSFGNVGRVITNIAGFSVAVTDTARQSDGKLVVVGTESDFVPPGENRDQSNATAVVVARYTSDGNLDLTFDGDGIAVASPGEDFVAEAHAVAIQSDGKILVVGDATNAASLGAFGQGNTMLVRFKTDGSLDTTFGGGDGIVLTGVHARQETATDVVVARNGTIYTAGTADAGDSVSTQLDFALRHYAADGTLDATFGDRGVVLTDLSFHSADQANRMALQSDGKILLAGSSSDINGRGRFAVARFNASGTRDRSFSSDGIALTDINSAQSAAASDLAIQSDGKIVLVGSTMTAFDINATPFVALARYATNGNIDTTFGAGGVISSSVSGNGAAVAIDQDGTILVANANLNDAQTAANMVAGAGSPTPLTVVRFDDRGVVESTATASVTPFSATASALILEDDGRITVAGTGLSPSDAVVGDQIVLARFLGRLTSPFAVLRDGTVTIHGTDRNDVVSITTQNIVINDVDTPVLAVTLNGQALAFKLSDVKKINVSAGNGDDSVVMTSVRSIRTTIDGGSGNDNLVASDGRDSLIGGSGNDSLDGGNGNDTLVGGNGNDLLFGNTGNDSLRGDSGNDILTGGSGRDSISGNDGNDEVFAFDGERDKIDGGKGTDTAHFDALFDSVKKIEIRDPL